jgi:hypothetical protein
MILRPKPPATEGHKQHRGISRNLLNLEGQNDAPRNPAKRDEQRGKLSNAATAPQHKHTNPLYITQDVADRRILRKYGMQAISMRPDIDALIDPVTTRSIAEGPEYEAHLRERQNQRLQTVIQRIKSKFSDRPLVMLVQSSPFNLSSQAGEMVTTDEYIQRQAQLVANGTGQTLNVMELGGLTRDDAGGVTIYSDEGSLQRWIDELPAKLRRNPAKLRRVLRSQGLHRVHTAIARVGGDDWTRGLSAAELIDSDDEVEYLIEGVLAKGQLMMLVGPVKSAKTSILIDMGVSLASGTAMLDYQEFRTHGPLRVGLWSGEGGKSILRSALARIAKRKQQNPRKLGMRFYIGLPQLSDAEQLARLASIIREDRLDVVMLDPMYLCLLGGPRPADAANMMQMGPLLSRVRDTIVSAGATPILCHHSTKSARASREPPELEQMAWAGFAEFAEQWLQTGLRDRYDTETGSHRLWLCAGGRAGHYGTYAVDIEEGSRKSTIGRKWRPIVRPASEEYARRKTETDARKFSKQAQEDKPRKATLIAAMVAGGGKASESDLKLNQGMGNATAMRVLQKMEKDGRARRTNMIVKSGKGKQQSCPGWELVSDDDGDEAAE